MYSETLDVLQIIVNLDLNVEMSENLDVLQIFVNLTSNISAFEFECTLKTLMYFRYL